MRAILICVVAVASLAVGCASVPPKQMAWQRIDGKYYSSEQLQADRAFCQGEVAKANLSDAARAGENYYGTSATALQRVMVGCMGGRGYILVEAN